jgi:hypothetical protein
VGAASVTAAASTYARRCCSRLQRGDPVAFLPHCMSPVVARLCRLERCTKVVRYLRYRGRAAQVIGTAVRDPKRSSRFFVGPVPTRPTRPLDAIIPRNQEAVESRQILAR